MQLHHHHQQQQQVLDTSWQRTFAMQLWFSVACGVRLALMLWGQLWFMLHGICSVSMMLLCNCSLAHCVWCHVFSQGEIFAAEGYAKTTGRVGVCIATSGPGATNLVTGLADAMMDSVPLVAITGQVRASRQQQQQKIHRQRL
jgi:hypothetical protein